MRRRTRAWLLACGAVLLASALLGSTVGAVALGPLRVAEVVGHHVFAVPASPTWSPAQDAVVWQVRVPRVVLGAAVGAGLAVCGVALQALVRNVLADPYLLGVGSGASTGAAASLLLGVGAGLGEHALPASAFVGALLAALLVLGVARASGRITSVRVLLAGVAVGYALQAATSFLVFASGSAEGARSVMFWLLGSLGLARWGVPLAAVVVVATATTLLLTALGRHLDALAAGDDTARALGTSPDRFRVLVLVLVSLCTGVLVAAAGAIGFVGLVVPHLARRAVGAAHARLVPVAALLGAALLVLADVLARTLLQPQELPLGVVTALVGAPFLLVLVRRLHAAA